MDDEAVYAEVTCGWDEPDLMFVQTPYGVVTLTLGHIEGNPKAIAYAEALFGVNKE